MFRRSRQAPEGGEPVAAARLSATLRLAPIWVFEQDESLRYTWLQNAETSGTAGGACEADLMERPEEAAEVERIKARVLSSGMPNTVEVTAHVSGEARRHRLHIEPKRDSAGTIVGLRGAILDLGPAVQGPRGAGLSLLRLVGHELRNAVNPVRMLVQLERRRAASGAATGALATAYAGVERLTAMLEDMLDYARSTSEPLSVTVEPVDLEAAIEQTTQRFLRLHPEAEGRFAVAPPPIGTTILADPARLSQCLLALLDRAARSTDRKQHVTVAAFVDEDACTIEIIDDGASLPGGGQLAIEDPVGWSKACLAEQRDEPPFAFALSQKLLEAMQAELQVEAREPAGTTVRLVLPLVTRPRGLPESSTGDICPPLEILVVDDTPGATQTMRLLLEGDGHTVREAQTGAQCLAQVEQGMPDVILLDIGLPDMPGLEVARRLRGRYGASPTIVGLTGRSSDEDRRNSREAGLDEHLVKPLDLALLRRTLRART